MCNLFRRKPFLMCVCVCQVDLRCILLLEMLKCGKFHALLFGIKQAFSTWYVFGFAWSQFRIGVILFSLICCNTRRMSVCGPFNTTSMCFSFFHFRFGTPLMIFDHLHLRDQYCFCCFFLLLLLLILFMINFVAVWLFPFCVKLLLFRNIYSDILVLLIIIISFF